MVVVRGVAVRAPFVLFVSLGLLGCQGDYPLEPTPCDRWCEAIKDKECHFYDPAQCVVDCEQIGIASRRECADAFEEALACFQKAKIPCDESDPNFHFPGPFPCEPEETALFTCVSNCPSCVF